jgi:AAA domain
MVLQLRGRDRPMFTRLNEEKANGRAHEFKAPLDVGAALEAMAHEGAGDTAVHLTQLKSTASLLRSGMATEEVVKEVMGATERAGKPTWNDGGEERKVLKLCFDFISKNPNLAYLLPEDLQAEFNTKIAAGCARISIRWMPYQRAWGVVGNGGVETERTEGGLPPLLGGFVPYDGSDIAPAQWIIKGLLPAAGVLILPGQWGTYKTTLEYEMALSITTGDAFAGSYRIKRPGAVMIYALEGDPQSNNRRMRAIAEFHGKGNPSLPIYWSRECPPLSHPNTVGEVVAAFNSVAARARPEHNVSVRVIWIDTYSIAAGHALSGDDNDRAATQKCFNTLRKISQQTGVLVAVIDHFGKLQEAGTTGSSGKEGNADAVLR